MCYCPYHQKVPFCQQLMTSCESHVVILVHVEPDQEIWYLIMGIILGGQKKSLLELFSSLEP